MMKPTIKVLRAITSEYLRGILKPIGVVTGLIFAIIFGIIIGLSIVIDVWWLAALLIIIPIGLVAASVFVVLWFATNHLAPKKMSSTEKQAVRNFTAKASNIIETVQGPWPVTVTAVAKDVLRDRESRVLTEVISNSSSLRTDFVALQQMFNNPPLRQHKQN